MFCDPDTFQPLLKFLSLKDLPSQDADGIKSAIIAAFNDIYMPELASKVVFVTSDGATVNSGVKSGLAVKFRLELALEDHLEEVIKPVKKCLTNLFYCYEKSSKKLRELWKLHSV